MQMEVARRPYFSPDEIWNEVALKVRKSRELGQVIDYLTFVPDGEPTLDLNLGQEIEMLKSLGIRIAVICNSSLIWMPEVREELCRADWISLKVDTVEDAIWRRINRPHRSLRLKSILQGIRDFSEDCPGRLAVETMLVMGANDSDAVLEQTADFLADVKPARAYLSIPTRPPAEEWALAPSAESVNRAYQIFSERLENVELLVAYEGDFFCFTGDAEHDLLAITAVHPMKKAAVMNLLQQAGRGWDVVQRLMDLGQLVETEYMGDTYYLRRFGK